MRMTLQMHMAAHVVRLVGVTVALLLVACAPSTAPGLPSPAPPVNEAAAAAPPEALGVTDWRADWDRTLAAARSEGKIVVSAQASDSYRLPLTVFEAEYPDIKVEYIGLTSPAFWSRVGQERAGGQYLWDVRIGGLDQFVWQARDGGVLDPLRPLLVLPEVLDDGKWLGGMDRLFVDRDKQQVLVFFAQEALTLFVNRDALPVQELPSAAQLLDPKFKGKIAMGDPRGGPGLGQLVLLLIGYGEDYLTQLLTAQDVTYTRELLP
jgi:iron(III) transport system substrate-binding protein